MASKWDNPYKVNAYRSATDVLALYEEHIRNTPRLWASLYEIDEDCPIYGRYRRCASKTKAGATRTCKNAHTKTKPLTLS